MCSNQVPWDSLRCAGVQLPHKDLAQHYTKMLGLSKEIKEKRIVDKAECTLLVWGDKKYK